MTDIGSAVSLIVAISELKAVQAIREPIHANLIARGGIDGALGTVTMPHGRVPLPERKLGTQFLEQPSRGPIANPHPAPRARVETIVERVQAVPATDSTEVVVCEPRPTEKTGPLVPPWRMPLDTQNANPPTVIKCPPPPPDVMSKGSLLDFFM